MRTRLLTACLAALLFACGGGDDTTASDTAASDDTASAGGDEAVTAPPADEGETAEADADEDDGMRCLPVSHCHSFANQDCALVDADGNVQGEEFSSGSVERACPGERGVADSVQECFDLVEISQDCRRRPELRHPEWPCGRTDTARCGIVM